MKLALPATTGLLLTALLISACAGVSATAEMRKTDAGPFTLALPEGLRQLPASGIDSHVGRYETLGFRVSFDYGAYSNRLEHVSDPGQTRTPLIVDGRACVLVSWRENGSLPHHTAIHFPLTNKDGGLGSSVGFIVEEANGLTLNISYTRPELAKIAEQICRSIRFKK